MRIMLPELPFVSFIRYPANQCTYRTYYGLNTSSSLNLEPVDQLDGFAVARCLQRVYKDADFFPYVAGVYGVFNARSLDEATKIAKKKDDLDLRKKDMLRNCMVSLGLRGEVLTTRDLWGDKRYWEIFAKLFDEKIYDKMPDYLKARGMSMGGFPQEVLGCGRDIIDLVQRYFSGSMYVPAEVAEALWLKERFGIDWKIGPGKTEEIYDRIIAGYGMGIIGLEQLQALENGVKKDVLPYIGKSTQPLRITFSDTPDTLKAKCVTDNSSFILAERLARELGYQTVDSDDPTKTVASLINLTAGTPSLFIAD